MKPIHHLLAATYLTTLGLSLTDAASLQIKPGISLESTEKGRLGIKVNGQNVDCSIGIGEGAKGVKIKDMPKYAIKDKTLVCTGVFSLGKEDDAYKFETVYSLTETGELAFKSEITCLDKIPVKPCHQFVIRLPKAGTKNFGTAEVVTESGQKSSFKLETEEIAQKDGKRLGNLKTCTTRVGALSLTSTPGKGCIMAVFDGRTGDESPIVINMSNGPMNSPQKGDKLIITGTFTLEHNVPQSPSIKHP